MKTSTKFFAAASGPFSPIFALNGCTYNANDESVTDREYRLYTERLEAGGSFYTDSRDFSCVLPGGKR